MTPPRVTNAVLSEKIDGLKETVDKLSECVYGDGNPKRGMIDRLARLENHAKIWWLILAGIVGLILERIF